MLVAGLVLYCPKCDEYYKEELICPDCGGPVEKKAVVFIEELQKLFDELATPRGLVNLLVNFQKSIQDKQGTKGEGGKT